MFQCANRSATGSTTRLLQRQPPTQSTTFPCVFNQRSVDSNLFNFSPDVLNANITLRSILPHVMYNDPVISLFSPAAYLCLHHQAFPIFPARYFLLQVLVFTFLYTNPSS